MGKRRKRPLSLVCCPGCPTSIPKGVFACKDCWSRIPVDLRDSVQFRYGGGRAEAEAGRWLRANRPAIDR